MGIMDAEKKYTGLVKRGKSDVYLMRSIQTLKKFKRVTSVLVEEKYASEDNESFNALVDKQNEKTRAKHAYLWHSNQIPSARQIAWRDREARRIEGSNSSLDLAIVRDTRPAMPNIRPSAPRNAFM